MKSYFILEIFNFLYFKSFHNIEICDAMMSIQGVIQECETIPTKAVSINLEFSIIEQRVLWAKWGPKNCYR